MGCQALHTKGKNFNRADSHAKWGKAEQGMEPGNNCHFKDQIKIYLLHVFITTFIVLSSSNQLVLKTQACSG